MSVMNVLRLRRYPREFKAQSWNRPGFNEWSQKMILFDEFKFAGILSLLFSFHGAITGICVGLCHVTNESKSHRKSVKVCKHNLKHPWQRMAFFQDRDGKMFHQKCVVVVLSAYTFPKVMSVIVFSTLFHSNRVKMVLLICLAANWASPRRYQCYSFTTGCTVEGPKQTGLPLN